MRPAVLTTVAFAASVIACTKEPVSPTSLGTTKPSLAASAGAGTAPYTLSLTGDLNTLSTATGQAVRASLSTKAPFSNLSVKGVRLTIGNPVVGAGGDTTYTPPTGDTTICHKRSSALPYVVDWHGNEGTWVGDLAADGTNYVKFNGARPWNAAETVQFTVNAGTLQRKDATTGAWYLEYTNATLVFGGTTTRPDLSHRRCVTFVLTASP